jgi:hypothetical protein
VEVVVFVAFGVGVLVVCVSTALWAIDDIKAYPEWAFRRASSLSQGAWVALIVIGFFFFGPAYLVVLAAWFWRVKPRVAAELARAEQAAKSSQLASLFAPPRGNQ